MTKAEITKILEELEKTKERNIVIIDFSNEVLQKSNPVDLFNVYVNIYTKKSKKGGKTKKIYKGGFTYKTNKKRRSLWNSF